jgi:aspartate/methionine/tyrosine aminotransferase
MTLVALDFLPGFSELVAVSACMLNTQSCYGVHQIMVPIPKYPLYSAAISLFGGTLVPYYLSEEANWQLDITDLQNSILAARREGITVQGLVLINPGNPTSQCLTEAGLKGLIELCIKETLVLLVDEVYQQNIYQDYHPFISARKVKSTCFASSLCPSSDCQVAIVVLMIVAVSLVLLQSR